MCIRDSLHSADSKTLESASPDSRASPGGHISHLALRRGFENDHEHVHGSAPDVTFTATSAAASAHVASTSTVSTAVPSAHFGNGSQMHGGNALGYSSPASSRSPFPSPGTAHAYASNGSSLMDRRASDGSQPSMPSIPQPGAQHTARLIWHWCTREYLI